MPRSKKRGVAGLSLAFGGRDQPASISYEWTMGLVGKVATGSTEACHRPEAPTKEEKNQRNSIENQCNNQCNIYVKTKSARTENDSMQF